MKTHVLLAIGAVFMVVAGTVAQQSPKPPATFGFGRAATTAEIAAWDIDVGPDGAGLPPGQGTATEGAATYAAKCASCHGRTGKEGPNDVLVGRGPFPSGTDTESRRTIGNYWPYATTIFDYVRRAMPFGAPRALTDDQYYAVTAYLLQREGIIQPGTVIDAKSLPAVQMPARSHFVLDDRAGTTGGKNVR